MCHVKRQNVSSEEGAFSLIELLAMILILGIIIAIAVVTLSRSKVRVSRIKCVNQLKNIGLAYRIFATDHNDDFPFQVLASNGGTLGYENDIVKQFLALTNELSTPRLLFCPTRTFGKTNGTKWYASQATTWSELTITNIDYFLNLDARENIPGRILAGDNCVRINGELGHGLKVIAPNDSLSFPNPVHDKPAGATGNAVFSDGSVQQFESTEWPAMLNRGALATNRFLFP
jgi:type II secretory pathway pseudopilin PulG